MTGWALVFLGAIAMATVTMAVIQIGAIIYAGRLARRVERLAAQVQQDVRPLIARATAITDEAARATSAAVAQVERVERLIGDLSRRVDETVSTVQDALVRPAREGLAVVAAVRAALWALRDLRAARRGRRVEDDDALFIG